MADAKELDDEVLDILKALDDGESWRDISAIVGFPELLGKAALRGEIHALPVVFADLLLRSRALTDEKMTLNEMNEFPVKAFKGDHILIPVSYVKAIADRFEDYMSDEDGGRLGAHFGFDSNEKGVPTQRSTLKKLMAQYRDADDVLRSKALSHRGVVISDDAAASEIAETRIAEEFPSADYATKEQERHRVTERVLRAYRKRRDELIGFYKSHWGSGST